MPPAAVFCLYPRLATKAGGIPPFDHFPLKKIYSSQNRKNLQVPASAHPGMEDDHVGNRELQTTMVRNKDTRTAAVPIQVDLGRLRAARIEWSEKSSVRQIEPRSQPEIADQPAALSEPIQPFPSEALGRRLALLIRHQSSLMRISRLHPDGNNAVCCVWRHLPLR